MTTDHQTDRRPRRPIADVEPGYLPPFWFVVLIVGLVLAILATFL